MFRAQSKLTRLPSAHDHTAIPSTTSYEPFELIILNSHSLFACAEDACDATDAVNCLFHSEFEPAFDALRVNRLLSAQQFRFYIVHWALHIIPFSIYSVLGSHIVIKLSKLKNLYTCISSARGATTRFLVHYNYFIHVRRVAVREYCIKWKFNELNKSKRNNFICAAQRIHRQRQETAAKRKMYKCFSCTAVGQMLKIGNLGAYFKRKKPAHEERMEFISYCVNVKLIRLSQTYV